MAAAALRSAATKVCRPRAYFTTAASAALKEKIGHGGSSSLRRFTTSESPNLLNNNKLQHLPTNNAEPTFSFSRQINEKKQELLHLLRQADNAKCAMELENKQLLHMLAKAPGHPPGSAMKFIDKYAFELVAGTFTLAAATIYLEYKLLLD